MPTPKKSKKIFKTFWLHPNKGLLGHFNPNLFPYFMINSNDKEKLKM